MSSEILILWIIFGVPMAVVMLQLAIELKKLMIDKIDNREIKCLK